MARRNWNRVFVTGGTSFLGLRVVAALIELGADVTVLVRPENEDKLGALRRHVRLVSGNVWDRASLKGRSRGHGVVVHLVGSIHAQPERGLTFQQLNLVSARNAISMAVSDGVPYFVLLSAVARPLGVPAEYIYSKREAEDYLRGSGLAWTIVHAPLLFDAGQRRSAPFKALNAVGGLPLVRVLAGRRTPLPVEIAARGIARLTLQEELPASRRVYAGDLRRLGRVRRQKASRDRAPWLSRPAHRESSADWPAEEVPFGWLPGPPKED
ncbi:MAG: NAD(P)H-binding protein [Anaerolineae bacterium]|nr:NAD(P)H-binding protein [Anaerolineae bacterium]